MKKLIGLVSSLLFVSALLFGAPKTDLQKFEQANELYTQNEFRESIQLYESLLESNYISEDLHFNLGNAYFKTRNISKAILHYEKALKINPNSEDAAHNLKLANEKTVDKVEAIPELFIYRWWRSIYNLLSANTWGIICIGFFFFSLIGFSTYLFGKFTSIKKIGFYVASIALVLGVCSWFLAAQQKSYLESNHYGIISEPTVNIISAPSEGSSQLFVLHEGTKVKIKEKKDDWLNISLPNGNEGWIKMDELETI